jgi:hypothetical protein
VPRTKRERLIAEGRLIPASDPTAPWPMPAKPLPGTPTTDEIIADGRRD